MAFLQQRKERRLSSSTPSMIPTPFFTKDTIPRNEADFRKRYLFPLRFNLKLSRWYEARILLFFGNFIL